MASSSKRPSVDSGSTHSGPQPRNEHPYTRSVTRSANQENGCDSDSLRRRSSSRLSLQSRRGSVASSVSSIGGNLDTSSYSHGVSESAHNGKNTNTRLRGWFRG